MSAMPNEILSDEDRELRARLGAGEFRKLLFQRDQIKVGWTWRDCAELDMHARAYEMLNWK